MNHWFLGYIDPQTPAQIPSLLAAGAGLILVGWQFARAWVSGVPAMLRRWGHRCCGQTTKGAAVMTLKDHDRHGH